VEVQFQPDDRIYERLITEAFLYLGQYRPDHRWRCVAIWAKSSLDGGIPLYYQEIVEIGLLKVVYLDQLPEGESLGLSLLRLVLVEEEQVLVELSRLERQLNAISNTSLEREIVELIEKVLIYKFPRLSPEELAAMFGQQELEQTRFYQEVLKKGQEEGLYLGQIKAIPNLLSLGLTAEQIAGALELELTEVQNEIAKLHQQN
jgi:predicted transposase/invertase (TIGR01784 family)